MPAAAAAAAAAGVAALAGAAGAAAGGGAPAAPGNVAAAGGVAPEAGGAAPPAGPGAEGGTTRGGLKPGGAGVRVRAWAAAERATRVWRTRSGPSAMCSRQSAHARRGGAMDMRACLVGARRGSTILNAWCLRE